MAFGGGPGLRPSTRNLLWSLTLGAPVPDLRHWAGRGTQSRRQGGPCMNPRGMSRFVVAFAVLTMLVPGAALMVHAQIPATFKNLKVLPKDISRPALVGQMRQVAGALGVRCGFCHAGGNPQT